MIPPAPPLLTANLLLRCQEHRSHHQRTPCSAAPRPPASIQPDPSLLPCGHFWRMARLCPKATTLALDCCPLTAPGMALAVHQCFSHPGVIFRVFSRPVLWFLSKPRTHANIQTLLRLDPLQPMSLCSCYTHLLPRAAWTCVKARSPSPWSCPFSTQHSSW